MSELLFCPFCGGEAEMGVNKESTVREYFVGCMNCHIRLYKIGYKRFYTEAEAIAAWNSRAERTCRNLAEPDEMSDEPFTCSECGARGPYGDGIYHIGGSMEVDGKLMFWDSWPVYKFCPNCGARVIKSEQDLVQEVGE